MMRGIIDLLRFYLLIFLVNDDIRCTEEVFRGSVIEFSVPEGSCGDQGKEVSRGS